MVKRIIKKRQKFDGSVKFLGLANAFSGGLFMGLALFHLLPEVNFFILKKN
jgi:hypothetical protein